ncbi:MAG: sugar phosphate isomerase/epimerase [Lachnospiraceae bacterium]|nr:sugar phosphate isomerase/epimerase [Lachnospiraceae bacterium]
MGKLPVGIQVYGLRDLLEETPERFEEVMRQVKEMGYDGVELAGLYGLEPAYVRDVLKKLGLNPVSAHVPLVEMMADAEKVAKDYTTIGCTYIVVPYLPEEYRPLTDGYGKVLEEMKRIGAVMAAHGLTLLYHNHDFEFVRLKDGTYGYDDIFRQVGSEYLSVEPDTCWIKVAGEDPAAYVRKYAGRVPIVHLKDFIKEGNPKNLYKLIGIETEEAKEETGIFEFRAVGFGQQIWEPILAASEEAGAKWVVVEQDEHYDLTSLECARRSREYLKILGW